MNLKVKNGFFYYNKSTSLLEDVNFELIDSDVLSILGPNGVGKTSLIKCIMGLLKWSSGTTLINGEDIKKMKDREIWNRISYIPQKRYFAFSYTGIEMVLLGVAKNLNLFEVPNKGDMEKAQEIMDKIGIGHLANKDCNKMSGGELQMVLIARSLLGNPRILILDEPESGLDFKNQLIILELLKNLGEQGVIVILNTHYPEHALSISNKSLLLTYDKKYKYGNTGDILNKKNIREAFSVNVEINNIKVGERYYKNILPISIVGENEKYCKE